MSAAAPALHRPGPFTILPPGAAVDLGRAARRMIDEFLWGHLRFGAEEKVVTSREIAEALGCSMRTAQEAVRQACERAVDGVKRPVIERFRRYGPAKEAGRVLRFVAPEIVPVPVEEPARARGKGKGDPGQIPNVGAVPPATPEQIAAAAAQQAAATSADAAKDPESSARALDELRMALGQVKRPKAKLPRAKPKVDLDAPVPPALGEKTPAGPIGDIIARLMGRHDPSGPPPQPAGP